MQYNRLGRTGLEASVAGLGCGGFSRLGQGTGCSEAESVAVVARALDLGINFLDTAHNYGTERIVGKAIAGRDRDSVILSTKAVVARGRELRPVGAVIAELEQSLRDLGVDAVDVFHLHGVQPWALAPALETIVPALEVERDKGKVRWLGITESPPNDPGHAMLSRAIPTGRFAVVMVAHHMLHQSAEARVYPLALEHDVGTLVMFAVRVIFSKPGRLQETMRDLAARGLVPAGLAGDPDPLGLVLREGGARSIVDAAYRYCRHQRGADVLLFGTGSIAHLESNVASILAPPLGDAALATLRSTFAHLEDVGLDAPAPAVKPT